MAQSSDQLVNTALFSFETDAINQPGADTGLLALLQVAKDFQIPVESDQLFHATGKPGETFESRDIIRQAQRLGLVGQETTLRQLAGGYEATFILMKGNVFLTASWHDSGQLQITHPVTLKTKVLALDHFSINNPVILFKKNLDISTEPQKKSTFAQYVPLLMKHRRSMIKILAASLVIQAFALISPKVFQVIIDKVLVNRAIDTLEVVALVLIAMAIYEPVMHFIRSTLFSHLSSCLSSEMLSQIYRHLLFLPMSFFQKMQSGNLMARLRELDHVRNFLAGSALMSVVDLMFLSVFLGVMFLYSKSLAWVVLATVVIIFIVWLLIAPFFQKRVEKSYQIHADNVGFLTESVTGIETIKSTATNAHFKQGWQERLSVELLAGLRMKLFAIIASQGVVLIQKLSTAVILWIGTTLVMTNKLSVGELVAFNMLASHVTLPILRIAQLWQDLQQSRTALKRLGIILDAKKETTLSAGKSSLTHIEGRLCFKQVSFRYADNTREILTKLSFDLEAKTCLGITGQSGSGKSSISKLIQKLYKPQSGQILIDDVDLTMADTATLRRQLGIVLQENRLFNATIRENIIVSNPCVSEEKFNEAVQLSGVDRMVSSMDNGFNTEAGEQGSKLSGGQKQRVAIARALINDPSIVIFDEATSALDYESEQVVLECIQKIKAQRTLIIISHRLNALTLCDNVIALSHGSIIEQGTHTELLALNGYYAKLCHLQSDC